jgi:glycosyltransferase involved in cell wall biosynthesis/GT2 family glycosyltransferase
MSDRLTASIVVNTWNRVGYLRRLLPALLRQRDVVFELVVVNGPSTDGTDALLEAYSDQLKVVSCPDRNLSRSRNLGIRAASGDIVVFIDDDALPGDEWWLCRFAQAFANDDQTLGAVGGPVLIADTEIYEFGDGMTSDYGLNDFYQSINASPRWIRRVQGCNAAFRRIALLHIGGFDEFFVYYLDESDVCLRLKRAGYHIVSLPDNPVRHYAARVQQAHKPRSWHIIARSDTYYALKNGQDRLFLRTIKTLAYAPRKHFVPEIVQDLRRIPVQSLLGTVATILGGYAQGFCAGLLKPRSLEVFPRRLTNVRPVQPRFASQRLRIALLTQTTPKRAGYGGVGRYTYDLALGLYERGHEVHIFSRDDRPIQREGLGFVIHGVMPHTSAPPVDAHRPVLEKNLAYSLAVARRLLELRKQGVVFDVVHASNWDAEALAVIRSRMCPVVLMLVSSLAQVIKTEGWEWNDDLRACVALDRWQIDHADTVCVPSQGVLDSYRELMGIDPAGLSHLVRTPLGIVPDQSQIAPFHGNRRKVLFVGRLEYRKGIHTLLAALPDVLPRFPEWECHIIGSASNPALQEQFLERYGAASWLPRVVFHGFVPEEELRWHYQTCDLFVAPSLYESFGLIFHEAMQYGKPVIGCATGGVPEVVTHGVEGLLVAPDDPEALRRAMERLMGDEALRARMGQAGRERVVQKQNYRTMAAGLEQVYYLTIERSGKVLEALSD